MRRGMVMAVLLLAPGCGETGRTAPPAVPRGDEVASSREPSEEPVELRVGDAVGGLRFLRCGGDDDEPTAVLHIDGGETELPAGACVVAGERRFRVWVRGDDDDCAVDEATLRLEPLSGRVEATRALTPGAEPQPIPFGAPIRTDRGAELRLSVELREDGELGVHVRGARVPEGGETPRYLWLRSDASWSVAEIDDRDRLLLAAVPEAQGPCPGVRARLFRFSERELPLDETTTTVPRRAWIRAMEEELWFGEVTETDGRPHLQVRRRAPGAQIEEGSVPAHETTPVGSLELTVREIGTETVRLWARERSTAAGLEGL